MMEYKKEVIEISPDGLAAVAVRLAMKSKYLQQHSDLIGAFWYFFDLLVSQQRQAKEDLDEEFAENKICEEGERLWGLSKSICNSLEPRAWEPLRRAYMRGDLLKPVTELTDDELLRLRGVGPKILADIRSRIPVPTVTPAEGHPVNIM